MSRIKTWGKRIALGFGLMVALGVVSLLVYQRISDGPTGPLAGGTFSTGEVVSTPVTDWSTLEGDFEFELVGQSSSRTAGGVLLDGTLYITCDLGFVWARIPSGLQRNVLHLIWVFKTWHEKALLDGRIRIRKDGRIHTANLEYVEDPQVIEALKVSLETMAAEFFGPDTLGARPQEEPNDIWFFRVTQ